MRSGPRWRKRRSGAFPRSSRSPRRRSSRRATPLPPIARTDLRLNRFLALAGLGARRKCEGLISEGRIEINGRPADTPAIQVDPASDVVRFDGERVRIPRSFVYLLMNKPSGVVVSASDERGRTTVYDLLPDRYRGKVRAVGRLDRASEGLLLFTNDGELAHALLHPSRGVERTYLAWVDPPPRARALRSLEEGISIGRGERSGPARVRMVGRRGTTGRVRVVLREGKNREVRRMFRAVGCRVLALRRVGFDGLVLQRLSAGTHRRLRQEEIASLRKAAGGIARSG
ncbi:MAG: pseudouridine synthase [Candidatus Eisenbacteria bacterium]|nr:pseudouridine synthase [Candidatus Latescibacterota bacterium]MBD3302141.1 pseudouridine synthase [Candidatus Eisenbacteria bacterium]